MANTSPYTIQLTQQDYTLLQDIAKQARQTEAVILSRLIKKGKQTLDKPEKKTNRAHAVDNLKKNFKGISFQGLDIKELTHEDHKY